MNFTYKFLLHCTKLVNGFLLFLEQNLRNFLLCPAKTFMIFPVFPYVTLCLASDLTFAALWVGSGTHKAIFSLGACALEVPNVWNTRCLALLFAGTHTLLRLLFTCCFFRQVSMTNLLKAVPTYCSPSQNAIYFLYWYHCHNSLIFCVAVYSFLA